jgi:hypothetical protein
MRAFALVLLLVSGCSLYFGPSSQNGEHPPDARLGYPDGRPPPDGPTSPPPDGAIPPDACSTLDAGPAGSAIDVSLTRY